MYIDKILKKFKLRDRSFSLISLLLEKLIKNTKKVTKPKIKKY